MTRAEVVALRQMQVCSSHERPFLSGFSARALSLSLSNFSPCPPSYISFKHRTSTVGLFKNRFYTHTHTHQLIIVV